MAVAITRTAMFKRYQYYAREVWLLPKKTPKGRASVSKPSIEYLRYDDDFVGQLFDWKELEHQRDSFCNPLLDCMELDSLSPDIQNVVGDLLWTRTKTRRLSMTKKVVGGKGPNLLNIPTRQRPGMIEGLAGRIRSGFICREGELFGGWDLSQIEMRVTAHLALVLGRDDSMAQIFHNKLDLHDMTASRMFNLAIDELDKTKHRIPAKTTGFGITYGQGAGSLMSKFREQGLEITKQGCQKFIDQYYNAYPGIKIAKEKIVEQCRRQGYIADLYGMVRLLPSINSLDKQVKAEAERKAFSHVIQGTAQGVLQYAMGWLWKEILILKKAGLNVKWRLQFHDELIFTFEESLWDIMNELVIEAMTKHVGMEFTVPIEADGNKGRSWKDLK